MLMEVKYMTGIVGPADKEERILEAAIAVFSEKGFHIATTKDIAAQAGVAEGTIFRYYKTKKDLLHGIILKMIKTIGSRIAFSSIEVIVKNADGKEPRAIIREVLNDRMKLIKRIFPMLRILISEALFHEDIRQAVYEHIIVEANDIISPLIVSMQEQGYMRNDLPVGTILRMIISNLLVFIGSRELFSPYYLDIDVDADFDLMFELMMNGFAPRGKANGQKGE